MSPCMSPTFDWYSKSNWQCLIVVALKHVNTKWSTQIGLPQTNILFVLKFLMDNYYYF